MLEKIPFIAALCFILLAAGSGYAAGLEQTVRNAGGLLKKGDADAALDLLREAQVDHPEAAELRFGVACALFVKGETLAESGATEEAKAAFGEAHSLFNGLTNDSNPRIAREAVFNAANTTAREALALGGGPDRNAAIAALRNAVREYETGLARFPDHDGLRQNLDHVQLKLKELLQSSQEQQEQQEEQQPPEDQPKLISRFGQAMTDLPGATAQVDGNTAILVPPTTQEGES